jgi:hypothetical protein
MIVNTAHDISMVQTNDVSVNVIQCICHMSYKISMEQITFPQTKNFIWANKMEF